MNKILVTGFLISGLTFGFMPAQAIAGCRINYSIQNNSNEKVILYHLKVKSKGGKWISVWRGYARAQYLRRSGWELSPGEKGRGVHKATFGCKAKRRYRFDVVEENFSDHRRILCKSAYYPSPTGWTKSTNINFGDISRHCR